MKLNTLAPWKKSYDKSRQHIKSRDITLLTRKSYGFCSSHAWMWELDYEEGWVSKNWCFWAVLLEKTLESTLDCKEIRPVIIKEISPEYSLEGLMFKLKLQYFGHLIWRTDSLEKTLMLWKIEVSKGERQAGEERINWELSLTNIYCAMLCFITQLCPTLYDPMDSNPPSSFVHGDFTGKNTGLCCHILLQRWIHATVFNIDNQ